MLNKKNSGSKKSRLQVNLQHSKVKRPSRQIQLKNKYDKAYMANKAIEFGKKKKAEKGILT